MPSEKTLPLHPAERPVLELLGALPKAKSRKLVEFLRWAVRSGRTSAEALEYAPIPPALVARMDRALDSVTVRSRR